VGWRGENGMEAPSEDPLLPRTYPAIIDLIMLFMSPINGIYEAITFALLAAQDSEDQCVQPGVAVGRRGEIVQLVAPLPPRGVEVEETLLEN